MYSFSLLKWKLLIYRNKHSIWIHCILIFRFYFWNLISLWLGFCIIVTVFQFSKYYLLIFFVLTSFINRIKHSIGNIEHTIYSLNFWDRLDFFGNILNEYSKIIFGITLLELYGTRSGTIWHNMCGNIILCLQQ